MSIKFDKILLRLADLLDMSCYRVSKPILHHNVEQMSEESAFHYPVYCINDSIQGNSETGNKVFVLPSKVAINTLYHYYPL